MKPIHATTSSFATYVRAGLLLMLSLISIAFIPALSDETIQTALQMNITNTGLLYAILVGFLMYITLTRKSTLDEAVSLELNKSRRIYHLAYNLSLLEPKLKPWFKNVEGALREYFALFQEYPFDQYDRGNIRFRKVTYTVYQLPTLHVPYNTELYSSLLEATAAATESREIINDKIDDRIGRFAWLVLLCLTMVFCWIIILATPLELSARLISASVIFTILLSLQFLYEYDNFNSYKLHHIAQQYADNLKRAQATTGTKRRK